VDASTELISVVVAPSGLLVAAACTLITKLRPIAFGAIPILLSAAWPGAEQASALLLALIVVSVLTGGLLHELLGSGRPSSDILLGAASLVTAVASGHDGDLQRRGRHVGRARTSLRPIAPALGRPVRFRFGGAGPAAGYV